MTEDKEIQESSDKHKVDRAIDYDWTPTVYSETNTNLSNSGVSGSGVSGYKRMIRALYKAKTPEELSGLVMRNIVNFLVIKDDRIRFEATQLVYKTLFAAKKQIDSNINISGMAKVFVVPEFKDFNVQEQMLEEEIKSK